MPPHKSRGFNFSAVRIVVHIGNANNGNLLETLVREQTQGQVHLSHTFVTSGTAFLNGRPYCENFLFSVSSVSEKSLFRYGLRANIIEAVGLPDAALRESCDRVRAALKNRSYDIALAQLTINFALADIENKVRDSIFPRLWESWVHTVA